MAANSVSGINIKIGADLTDLKTEVGKVGKVVEDGLKEGDAPTKTLSERFKDTATNAAKIATKAAAIAISLGKISQALSGFVKGAVEDALAVNPETAAQVEAVKEAFDSVKLAIGEALMPLIDKYAPLITEFLTSVATWITENPEAATAIVLTAGAISTLGSVMAVVQPIIALFGLSLGTVIGPAALVVAGIAAVVGIVALLNETLFDSDESVRTFNGNIEEINTATEQLKEDAYGNLVIDKFEYTDWFDPETEEMVEARFDEITQSWITKEEDLKNVIGDTSAAIAEQGAAMEDVGGAVEEVDLSGQAESASEAAETASEKAQAIMEQMQQTIEGVNTAADTGMTDALSGVNELLDSAAFQQFANQPVSEEVGASWESFGESVTSASTGFQTLTQTLLGGEEGADPEATPLAMALQTISDKVRSVYGESKRLAEYWQDTFPSSVQTMLAVLCVTSTDEEGNVNAGGGNTLVTALGVVFDLFGDILTTSQQLAGFWTTEFVAASITMRNEAGPTGKAVMKMGAFASGAADQFYNMAAAILAVVDAMVLLKGVKVGGSSGGSSGGGKKGGGKLKGNRDMTRASGGPVFDGLTYLVGENGPELFTPNRNGYIVPNEELSASRESITVNIGGNIYGESYLQNYVVGTLTTAIRQELKTAA